MKKIPKWVKRLVRKYRTKKGMAFLEKHHLKGELEDVIRFAMDSFGDGASLILADFLQLVLKYRDTFSTEEEYARWLGWQIKQYKKDLVDWSGPVE
ncbi:MAG: hypothetical protein NUV68_05790 [Caldiserica bacterium]|nr:hypothetical protein [Caldisericota bacterium]MDH7562837.1 hypothetical protein [Caldisericota bacterium]